MGAGGYQRNGAARVPQRTFSPGATGCNYGLEQPHTTHRQCIPHSEVRYGLEEKNQHHTGSCDPPTHQPRRAHNDAAPLSLNSERQITPSSAALWGRIPYQGSRHLARHASSLNRGFFSGTTSVVLEPCFALQFRATSFVLQVHSNAGTV